MNLLCGRCSACLSRVNDSFSELKINNAYLENETAGTSLSDAFEDSFNNKKSYFIKYNKCSNCNIESSFEFETAIFPVVVQLDFSLRVGKEVKRTALANLSVSKTITINVS